MSRQQEAYKVFIIGPPSSIQLSHQDAFSSETAGLGQIPVFLKLTLTTAAFPQPRLLTGLRNRSHLA